MRVNIGKLNWKKLNSSLEGYSILKDDAQTINSILTNIMTTHTPLEELLFIREYFASVMFRIHKYFAESNSMASNENITDIYDYVISRTIFATELAFKASFDVGISYFITSIVDRLFNVEAVNSAYVHPDNPSKFATKFVIEPVIANVKDRVDVDKIMGFIEFIFNTFSYMSGPDKFVSISVLCSPVWLKGFKDLPYFVDDSILHEFSSDANNFDLLNQILVSRRTHIIESLSNYETDSIEYPTYTLEQYIEDEPEELYEEVFELVEAQEEEETFIDTEIEELISSSNTAVVEVPEDDDDYVNEFLENELVKYDKLIKNLCILKNGPLINHKLTEDRVNGIDTTKALPRIHTLFNRVSADEVDPDEVIRALRTYELEKRQVEITKKEKVQSHAEKVKQVKKEFDDFNKQKETDDLIPLSNKYFDEFLAESKVFNEVVEKEDFNEFLVEMLSVYSKENPTTKPAELSVDVIKKILDAYQNTKNIKLNTDIKEKSGQFVFTQNFGKKFSYTIEPNGKFFVATIGKDSKKLEITAKKGKK